MAFVHLNVHSEYSVVDSIIRLDGLVKKAAAADMPALALTDLGNVSAAVKFYNKAIAAGIKPILGCELRLNHSQGRVTLLATNNQGWKNLLQLVSQSYIDGLTLGEPIVHRDWLLAKYEGLIVLLGAHSDVGQTLAGNSPDKAWGELQQWKAVYGNRVYLAISRTGKQGEDDYIEQALALAEATTTAVVATNAVCFVEPDDYLAHEARVCIAKGEVLIDEKRVSAYSAEQYFKSISQMQADFSDLPEVLANTLHVAKRCNVVLDLGNNYLPQYAIPAGLSEAEFFAQTCQTGLNERLAQLYPQSARGDNWPQVLQGYSDRLQIEIKTIVNMGFTGYFLIVMDFIQWAKNNDIPVGPGRGSGAGSLVAYALKITDLDPLRYDLLFERFLNPERVSMPDFDIDFCVEKRDKVIDYVAHKYGRDAVSQIITFGTMAAKAVIRDVARVQGKSYGLADKLSKLIPATPGITLLEALEQEPQLGQILHNADHLDHEDANEIWEMALKLEGITRNTGKHAGGVLIAPGKISDFSAVACDEEGSRVSQFDKDDVESVGLVKFDFLGLRNLTVIDKAIKTINQRLALANSPLIDLNLLPLDDKPTYTLLQKTLTTAVFQLESPGMRKYLGRLKPTNIDDIIAMCALYRPGPLEAGMVEMFIDRKHGREKVEYPHPDLQEILQSTYGVIVYQEQVMQIAQVLAGYTLGGADMLRRAMGKKKPEEMAAQRTIFVEGAKACKGMDAAASGAIFDLMEKFAAYGFNKSHSAAYGIVAYQTAYLKAHYPAEFMAAVLSSEMHNTDNIVSLISDCRALGLTILPPSVNQSYFDFRALDLHTIVYGLGAIKGVGEGAMEAATTARTQHGAFASLFDFCNRIDLRKANKRTLEALISAGAMDGFGQDRQTLFNQLPDAMQAAEKNRSNSEQGMQDLFADVAVTSTMPTGRDYSGQMSDEDRLQGEKDALGLYLTGHPMDLVQSELSTFIKQPLKSLAATGYGATTLLAGLIVDVANFNTRFVIRLDDGSARLEVSCPPLLFEKYKDTLKTNDIVVLEAEVVQREGYDSPTVRLKKAFALALIRAKRATHIAVNLVEGSSAAQVEQLHSQLLAINKPVPGQLPRQTLPLRLVCVQPYAVGELLLGDAWQLEPTAANLAMLRKVFGKQSVTVVYRQQAEPA